jgi:acyl dehydratase
VYGEITEVTPSKPDRGTISIKAETRNQRGDVVQSFTATLLVPRRA